MELVVEDGTGVVTANAYATVEEIDELLSYHVHSTWSTITDDELKANLIIWASDILDMRTTWFGCKTYETSGLAWPRTGVRDREGIAIDDNIVPDEVKRAVATLADYLIAGNPDTVNTSNNITMLQADVVVLKFDPYAPTFKFPDSIAFIIKGLGYTAMGRGGPKRIIKH